MAKYLGDRLEEPGVRYVGDVEELLGLSWRACSSTVFTSRRRPLGPAADCVIRHPGSARNLYTLASRFATMIIACALSRGTRTTLPG